MNDKSGKPFSCTSLHISSFLTMRVVFVVLVGAVVVVAVVVWRGVMVVWYGEVESAVM